MFLYCFRSKLKIYIYNSNCWHLFCMFILRYRLGRHITAFCDNYWPNHLLKCNFPGEKAFILKKKSPEFEELKTHQYYFSQIFGNLARISLVSLSLYVREGFVNIQGECRKELRMVRRMWIQLDTMRRI